jgi:hypothetical protein
LIILLPISGSSAQEGIRPPAEHLQLPLAVLGEHGGYLLGGGDVVAGGREEGNSSMSNRSVNTLSGLFKVYLPHMGASLFCCLVALFK